MQLFNSLYHSLIRVQRTLIKKSYIPLTFSALLITGCVTPLQSNNNLVSTYERANFLTQNTSWTLKGKIAFLSPKEKQSANFFWRKGIDKTELKLTTFLGVNVLSLVSEDNFHTLKVDSKTYQHHNLTTLLEGISGLNLPVEAFELWLKGLTYNESDILTRDSTNDLPIQLSSEFNQQHWQLTYDKYQAVDNIMMAHKIVAKQNDLTIKLAISQWQFDEL